MSTLNISWQLTAPVHDGQYAERKTAQPTRQARKRRVPLPATLLAFSLTIPCLANDRVFYHGTICHPVNASRNIVEYNQYGVYNMSTTAVAKVECPVPTYLNDELGAFFYARVTVFDRHTSANVSCTLRRLDNTDGGIYFQQTKSSTGGGAGAGPQQLQFFEPNSPVTAKGYWHLECSLPPKQAGWVSHILGIELSGSFY